MNIVSLAQTLSPTPVDGTTATTPLTGAFDALILAQLNVGNVTAASPALPAITAEAAVAPGSDALPQASVVVPVATAEMVATLVKSATMLPRAQAVVTPATPAETERPVIDPAAIRASVAQQFSIARAVLPVRAQAVSTTGLARVPVSLVPRRENRKATTTAQDEIPLATPKADEPVSVPVPQAALVPLQITTPMIEEPVFVAAATCDASAPVTAKSVPTAPALSLPVADQPVAIAVETRPTEIVDSPKLAGQSPLPVSVGRPLVPSLKAALGVESTEVLVTTTSQEPSAPVVPAKVAPVVVTDAIVRSKPQVSVSRPLVLSPKAADVRVSVPASAGVDSTKVAMTPTSLERSAPTAPVSRKFAIQPKLSVGGDTTVVSTEVASAEVAGATAPSPLSKLPAPVSRPFALSPKQAVPESAPVSMGAGSAEVVATATPQELSANIASMPRESVIPSETSVRESASVVPTKAAPIEVTDATARSEPSALPASVLRALVVPLPEATKLPETTVQSTSVAEQVASVVMPDVKPTPVRAPSSNPVQIARDATPSAGPVVAEVAVKVAVDRPEVAHKAEKPIVDLAQMIQPAPLAARDAAFGATLLDAVAARPDIIAVDRHLDLARGDVWLDDLARDIVATAAQGGRLKFALAPETMGRLDVEVHQSAAGISVHMAARNETARDMLTAAQPRIVDEIRAQGVRVAGTEVSASASGFGGDRTGGAPRQPTALPIDVARPSADASQIPTPDAVTDGRYA